MKLILKDGFYETTKFTCSIGDAISSVVSGVSSLFGGGDSGGSSGTQDYSNPIGPMLYSGKPQQSSDILTSLGGAGGFLGPSLLSAGANALGAYFASANQAAAANSATDAQLAMFGQTQQNLLPFIQTGQGATSALANLTGLNTSNPLTSPLLQNPLNTLSQSALAQTPGYQFELGQGLESVQNSAAARGLGNSGAALKGAANYAQGLASSNYQQQFNIADQVQQQQFSNLLGLGQQGQNSAVNLGAQGVQTGSNVGSNIIGAANAGSAAITSAAGNVGNALTVPSYLSALSSTNGQGY